MVAHMKHESDVDVGTSEIPEELLAEYEKAIGGILPVKSTDRYIQAYNVFRKWQSFHGTGASTKKSFWPTFPCHPKSIDRQHYEVCIPASYEHF